MTRRCQKRTFVFSQMDKASAQEIITWAYEPPYDIYNVSQDVLDAELHYLLNPVYAFYCLHNTSGTLEAFCSFGQDGQVTGGDYRIPALDIGMGVRPDLTGRGHGADYITAILDFARHTFNPSAYRVTIAAFNRRAQRAWLAQGFQQIQAFQRPDDGRSFIMFMRMAAGSREEDMGITH